MSYYTEILLMAGIREDKLEEVRSELANPLRYQSDGLGMFLTLLTITEVNTFHFMASGHSFDSEYCEDEEDMVQALKAPWCDSEDLAAWMARYANDDSRMLFHSLEANGLDFGYEFDGRGRYRYLELRPVTRWQKGTLPATAPLPKEKKEQSRKVKAKPKKKKQL